MKRLCFIVLLAAVPLLPQAPSGWQRIQQHQLADALLKVRAPGAEHTNALDHYVQVIEDNDATGAIPDLEALEAKVPPGDLKLKIDAALVRMHDDKPQYWQAVLAAATEAAGSDMPFPYTDSNQLDPYFKSKPWQGAAMQAQIERAMVLYPKAVMHLGETADPRGDTVLRLATKSPNILVVMAAAGGLAELKDEAAVPLILKVDSRLSPPMKGLLAHTMVYFNSPKAKAYVKQYLPAQESAARDRWMKPTPYSGVHFEPMPQER